MDLADYVLSKFTQDERSLLAERASIYLDQVDLILNEGLESAMNSINQRKVTPHERND
jgi:peptidyl-tRNA hydrolase